MVGFERPVTSNHRTVIHEDKSSWQPCADPGLKKTLDGNDKIVIPIPMLMPPLRISCRDGTTNALAAQHKRNMLRARRILFGRRERPRGAGMEARGGGRRPGVARMKHAAAESRLASIMSSLHFVRHSSVERDTARAEQELTK